MYLLKKLTKLHKLSGSNDKRIQSTDSTETYTYATRIDLVLKKKKLKVTI